MAQLKSHLPFHLPSCLRLNHIRCKDYLRENKNLILRRFHSSIKFNKIFFFFLPFIIFFAPIFLIPAVLVLVFVVYSRRRESHIKYPGPDDDVRENIINYDDEGGGEDDMTAFDITPLQIPIGGPMPELTQCKMPPIMCKCEKLP